MMIIKLRNNLQLEYSFCLDVLFHGYHLFLFTNRKKEKEQELQKNIGAICGF